MYIKPTKCPKCLSEGDDLFSKKGYFRTGHNRQGDVPRYVCGKCGHKFSSHSTRANKFHKKPEINAEVFKWVCSGVSLAQIARNLKIDKKTIERKILWLSNQAKIVHMNALFDPNGVINRVSHIQLDEMETFESSRLKPLSITIAIDADTGFIFALDVAVMNCHGKLAPKSREKYGLRKDTRRQSLVKVLSTIKHCKESKDASEVRDEIEDRTTTVVKETEIKAVNNVLEKPMIFSCDSKKTYVPLIKKIFPDAEINQYLLSKQKRGEPKVHDPLFTINHLCARLRADVAPLARKSWTTTKSVKGLQNLLWIYLAWMNKYPIAKNTNTID